jgi:hypothetical protein
MIDELVNETRHSISSRLVIEDGIFSKAPDLKPLDKLVEALKPTQRTMLSEMLQHERESAIHDVLAVMTWWMTTRDVGLTYQGKPMAIELSGMGLHGDFAGRCDDWEWPDEES